MAPRATIRTAARRMPRDQRVAAILRSARVVLRERGSEQFLTSEVAERCGISEGTIYKYFPTKRDLLIQVGESWFDEFLAEDYPIRLSGPIEERLYHVIWWSLSIIRREPALTRFVLMELRADPNYRNMRIYQQNREIVDRVMSVIAEGTATGELRANLPLRVVRNMIFGAIEHETWVYLRGEGDFSVDYSTAGITNIIIRGISATPKPADAMAAVVGRLETVAASLERKLRVDD